MMRLPSRFQIGDKVQVTSPKYVGTVVGVLFTDKVVYLVEDAKGWISDHRSEHVEFAPTIYALNFNKRITS